MPLIVSGCFDFDTISDHRPYAHFGKHIFFIPSAGINSYIEIMEVLVSRPIYAVQLAEAETLVYWHSSYGKPSRVQLETIRL